MNEWPEELCTNCGNPKEPGQTGKLCINCAMLLDPTERIEIKVTPRFLQELEDAMVLGHYQVRSEFIREAIRHFIRYLKGEQDQKNVIEGVVERLTMKRTQNLKIIEDAIEELKEMP